MNVRVGQGTATLTNEKVPLRVADAVARTLYGHGIRHAFGMPGGEVVTLVDALETAGIGFVLMRQESGAAIAAAAAGLFTNSPGLLVTTLGPGLANAVNGIADAVQERMPLVVITGVVDAGMRGHYTHQVLDHSALLRGAGVKASFEIDSEAPAAVVRRAIALSLTPPFGPVHLDLAPSVAVAMLDQCDEALFSQSVTAPPRPDEAALESVRALLSAAKRPIVIAGFEAAREGAAGPLAELSARHGIPVITTYKGKGILDENHPLSLGAAGLSPKADMILLPLVREADLVLLAGYDPIEMRPGWRDPFGAQASVVDLTVAPADHGMHRTSLTVLGSVAASLAALSNAEMQERWPGGEPASARSALDRAFSPPSLWGPHTIVEALQAAVPEDAVITVDSGAHRILFSQRWCSRRPLSLLQSAGWCTMGSALPLAIGASIEQPRRPIVAVLGDGGVEMTLGELGTLRDQGLPVVVVVLQDASLALIALKQQQAGLRAAGVGLGRTDLAATARAFGGTGITVRDGEALDAALAVALTRPTFSVIACELEASAYVGRI